MDFMVILAYHFELFKIIARNNDKIYLFVVK